MPNHTRPLTKTELSELALDAAIEMDLGLSRPNQSSAAVKFLDIISHQITSHDGSLFLRDESLVPIYSYALNNDLPQEYVGRQGMLSRLSQLVGERFKDEQPRDGLRRFFLAVHEALATDLMDEHSKTIIANEQQIR